MSHTIDYAIELDPDFANFYPAVPYPGTALYDKVVRDGLLVEEDWSRMEYSVLSAARQRARRARGDGRHQSRQAALLHAAGIRRAPAGRRGEARRDQAGNRRADSGAGGVRRAGGQDLDRRQSRAMTATCGAPPSRAAEAR